MLENHSLTAIVLSLALLVYVWVFLKVGAARGKHGVKAPATEGPPEFNRIFRVQMNTLEQLAIFVPSLALFAMAWSDGAAALIGILWPIGRVQYAVGYYQDADKRHIGFAIAAASTGLLLLGGFAGALMAAF